MARALIVGCGCRGRALGESLLAAGWQVRGTTRDPRRAEAIAARGVEAVVADPDRVGTVYDCLAEVTLVYWLLGSAAGGAEALEAIHGPRLERLLEKVVDTAVRGFVYEAAGTVAPRVRDGGARLVREAGERWRIPVEVVASEPGEWEGWRAEMLAAAERLTASRL